MAEPVAKEEEVVEEAVKEEKICYPTIPMLIMMTKYANLTKGSTEEEQIAFAQTHMLNTNLKHRESLIIIEATFVFHLYKVRDDMTYQDKLKSLVQLQEKLGEDMIDIGGYYNAMMDLLEADKTCFFALTRDKIYAEPFDLRESAETAHYITTKECNVCHAKKVKLDLCGQCHGAAYCGKDCQKLNWPFHKHFCEMLKAGGGTLAMGRQPPTPTTPTQTNI